MSWSARHMYCVCCGLGALHQHTNTNTRDRPTPGWKAHCVADSVVTSSPGCITPQHKPCHKWQSEVASHCHPEVGLLQQLHLQMACTPHPHQSPVIQTGSDATGSGSNHSGSG